MIKYFLYYYFLLIILLYKNFTLFFIHLNTSFFIFQALGNFYFIHEAIKEASLWDFHGN